MKTKLPIHLRSGLATVTFIAAFILPHIETVVRAAPAITQQRGGLKIEIYDAIPTADIDELLASPKFPDHPDQVAYLTAFTTRPILSIHTRNDYGARISGWILPPESGQYDFFLRSDNPARFYISHDEFPETRQLAAEETLCCRRFEETAGAAPSASIHMIAGRRYYIELLYKSGDEGHHAQVTWRRATDPTPAILLQPITGQFLEVMASPGTLTPPTLAITAPADNTSSSPVNAIAIEVSATAAGEKEIVAVDLYQNGAFLARDGTAPFTFAIEGLPEDAHTFSARATDSAGISAQSAPVNISVGPPRTRTPLVVIDEFTTWRYDQSARDLGSRWRQRTFNDNAWLIGRALFGDEFGTTAEPLRTLVRSFTGSGDPIRSIYFRTRFTWTESTEGVRLHLRHIVDDGAVFYLNGTEVHRFGIPPGTVKYSTTADDHENAYEGPYSIVAEQLVEGENVLAAEVHQHSPNSSDIVFGAELVATIPLPGSVPPRIESAVLLGGEAVISWSGAGTLESADSITGPWLPVSGATSPYNAPSGSGMKFFRVRSGEASGSQ